MSPASASHRLARSRAVQVALLAAVLALTRLPWVFAASDGRMIGVDELDLALSAVDRLLGVPHAELHWPGTTLHLILLPVIGVRVLLGMGMDATADAVVRSLAACLAAPWPLVVASRVGSVVLSSAGIAILALGGRRKAGSATTWALVAAAAIVAASPHPWLACWLGMTEGVALGFACACLAWARPGMDGDGASCARAALAGAALGLAIASKVTFVIVAPLALALVWHSGPAWRRAASFILGSAASFLLACPWAWTEPLRFLKAVVGNIAKVGDPLGAPAALRLLASSLGLPLLGLLATVLVALALRRRILVVAGALAGIGLLVASTAGAAVAFERYFVPVAAIALVLFVEILAEWTPESAATRAALLVTVVAGVAWGSFVHARLGRSPYVPVVALVRELEPGPSRRIAAPHWMLPYLWSRANPVSMRRMAEGAEAALVTRERRGALTSRGAPLLATAALPWNFVENDLAFAARARLLAEAGLAPDGHDLILHGEDDFARRFGIAPREKVLEMWRSGELDVLVLDGEDSLEDEPCCVVGNPGSVFRVTIRARGDCPCPGRGTR